MSRDYDETQKGADEEPRAREQTDKTMRHENAAQMERERVSRIGPPRDERSRDIGARDTRPTTEPTQQELRESARRSLPAYLHGLVEEAEVLSVRDPVEDPGTMQRVHDAVRGGHVVTLKLNSDLPVGGFVRDRRDFDGTMPYANVPEKERNPQFGRYYLLEDPTGHSGDKTSPVSRLEATELAVKPPNTPDYRYATSGFIVKGTTIAISAMAPRSYSIDTRVEMEAMQPVQTTRSSLPMSRELAARTYQVQILPDDLQDERLRGIPKYVPSRIMPLRDDLPGN